MSLQVILTEQTARAIVNNFDGSYDIYANEDKRILPGQITYIKTGNIISLPLGYYTIVQPCELLQSQSIDVYNFASVHYHKYKFKKFSRSGNLEDIKNDLTEFIITAKNVGRLEHLVKKGDVVAKLLVVKTEIFKVNVVNKIETEIDDQEDYELEKEIVEEKKEIKKIDKNVFLWYKKIYIKNYKFLLHDLLEHKYKDIFESIQNTEDWQIAANKLSYEASVLWEIISSEDREKIVVEYNKTINSPKAEKEEIGIDLDGAKKYKKKLGRSRKMETPSESEDEDDSDF